MPECARQTGTKGILVEKTAWQGHKAQGECGVGEGACAPHGDTSRSPRVWGVISGQWASSAGHRPVIPLCGRWLSALGHRVCLQKPVAWSSSPCLLLCEVISSEIKLFTWFTELIPSEYSSPVTL